jgi:PKD repeat protein
MNGTSSNAEEGATSNDAYDVGVQLTSAGASGSNSDSITFTISGISLDQLDGQRFGIRLQNTLNAEGSLKLEGVFERPDAPECNFSGYSRGSWLYGDRSGDRDPLLLKYDLMETTFEELFLEAENDAVTYGGVQNTTITGALDLNGGGNNQLAAQATAAYLNALYFEQDNDQLTCYRLTTEQIKTLTADALVGNSVNLDGYYWYVDDNAIKGFDAGDSVVLGTSTNNAEDLKNLFDFNNNLSGLLTPLPNPMVTV